MVVLKNEAIPVGVLEGPAATRSAVVVFLAPVLPVLHRSVPRTAESAPRVPDGTLSRMPSTQRREPPSPNRRHFLFGTAAGAATLLGGNALARRRSDELNVAFVGVGGMGAHDLASVAAAPGVRVAALCDVDLTPLDVAASKHEGARTFTDWRRLFDVMAGELDAVVVSTPDHMHAPISLAAMELDKHVYCQKPLAHNLRECRAMAAAAAGRTLATQMGTQIHSEKAYRTAVATVRAGAIGKVREAHLWVSRSWAGPAEGRPAAEDPVPDELAWDLWLGVAPARPFVTELYHPRMWRGWRDFGSGTLGDMGCHIFDPVVEALGLGAPTRAVSHGPAHAEETFAADGDVRYVFSGTELTAGELSLRWTDGSGVSRPDQERAQLPEGVELPGAGSFLVGEKGVMVIPHWSTPRLYRDGAPLDVPLVEEEGVDHYAEWVAACRGEGSTSTPFSYSGPLSEAVLLGTVAAAYPGRELTWHPDEIRLEGADASVGREYRAGWSIPGLGD